MKSVRPVRALVVAALAALLVPAAGRAASCTVLTDASGDAASWLRFEGSSSPDGVDLLALRMDATSSELLITWEVVDLSVAESDAYFYVVWEIGDAGFAARASRVPEGWSFAYGDGGGTVNIYADPSRPVVFGRATEPTTGSASEATNEVTVRVPLAGIGSPAPGALLDGIFPTSGETQYLETDPARIPLESHGDGIPDSEFDHDAYGSYILGSSC